MRFDRARTTRRHFPAAALGTLLAAVLSSSVSPSAARATNDQRSSQLESTVDASITPGDDFFAYANGVWLGNTAIPAGKERWGARDELENVTRRRIAALVKTAGTDAPAGSPARMIADYHAAYLNEAAIEARGLSSLGAIFDRIEKVWTRRRSRACWLAACADVDPMGFGIYQSAGVLGLAVQQSIHGERPTARSCSREGWACRIARTMSARPP